MKNILSARRMTTAAASSAIALSLCCLAAASPASAAETATTTEASLSVPSVPQGAVYNCGWVTCTLYIPRGLTRAIGGYVSQSANTITYGIAGAFAIACSPLGPYAVPCAAVGGVLGGYAVDQFIDAAAHHDCIAIKFLDSGALIPVALNPDNSGYCHD